MLINEIAKKCNTTKKAIQYYVEQGMIIPNILENGYKDFSEFDVKTIKEIVLFRELGLSIREIKQVLENHDKIAGILHRRTLELEREKVKQELLKRIEAGENVGHLENEIHNINATTIIGKKLTELFPGYYGKFISLNFSRYLSVPIETEEQMQAFDQIIEFFDNVPDIDLPEELQQYLDAYQDECASLDEGDMIDHILEEKEQAMKNIETFIEKNKELLNEYQKYRQTEEYKNSPTVRLMEYMKQICSTNGYYDVFIPAMRRLSPLYDTYYKQMLKANEIFVKSYPEYSV